MASGKRGGRIEPGFEADRKSDASGFAVSADDRIVRGQSRSQSKSQAKSKRKQAAPKGARRAREGSATQASCGGRRGSGRRGCSSRRGLFYFLGRLIYWSLVLCIWAGIAGAGVVIYYGAKMPSATTWEVPDRPPNVKIVAVDGMLIANRGLTGGEAVGLHEMSPYIPQAVVAIEDRRFYSHFGVDPIGLARSVWQNLSGGRVAQGGSTLTQQLAKNLFLKPERTLERKVQEVLLAFWLEQNHTKDQILEIYLNRVYFGSGSYGVTAASRRYFGTSARDVTLSQAAILAGLLKAPTRLSPARDPKAAEERAQVVLSVMRDQGLIGDKELASAMSAPLNRSASYWTGSEHYVADRVMAELPSLIGEVKGDIIVETTLDQTLQHFAELSIRKLIDESGDKFRVSQGALVSIDNSGAIRALVGGHDYAASQFDRASAARRQPGSAFKPFVFLAALEKGARPESIRNDAPISIGKWRPENYEGKYYGPVTLSTALARSLNSVAAQLGREAGIDHVIEVARRLGISSSLVRNASLSLGTSEVTPLELTAAYVPFANGGFLPQLHIVRRVTTTDGKLLYGFKEKEPQRVIKPELVGMMNVMMQNVVETGTGRKAAFGWPAGGKSGTTQNARDAWFVGYTSNLTTGVWFGNDDGTAMRNATGGSLATLAWHDFMAAAHEGIRPVPLAGVARYQPIQPEDQLDTQPDQSSDSMPLAEMPRSDLEIAPSRTQLPAPQVNRDSHENPATGTIRRPKADVGSNEASSDSILSIILGN